MTRVVCLAGLFLSIKTMHELNVDTSRGETIQIHVRSFRRSLKSTRNARVIALLTFIADRFRMGTQINITFPHMPCVIMSLDAMDVSGEAHLDVIHNIYKACVAADHLLRLGSSLHVHFSCSSFPFPQQRIQSCSPHQTCAATARSGWEGAPFSAGQV